METPEKVEVTKEQEIEVPFYTNCSSGDGILPKLYKACYKLVNTDLFQNTMIGFILLNAILMGAATFKGLNNTEKYPAGVMSAIDAIDEIVLIIFTGELLLNLYVWGITRTKKSLCRDMWLAFDFASVTMSWLFSDLKMIRSLRIFRALRLFGRVGSLRRILEALMSTGPQMTAICLVLILIYYIFAVMFTQLFGECPDPNEPCFRYEDNVWYFSRLDYTFYTLFLLMNFEDWAQIVRHVQTRFWWSWIPIITFMTITALVMINLVVAVLCDSLAVLKDQEEENERNEENGDETGSYVEGTPKESDISASESRADASTTPLQTANLMEQQIEQQNMEREVEQGLISRQKAQKERLKAIRLLHEYVDQLQVVADDLLLNGRGCMKRIESNSNEEREHSSFAPDFDHSSGFPTSYGFFHPR